MLVRMAQDAPKEALFLEAITFAAALFVAEAAYKFHSFTLEVIAFLATWVVFSVAARSVLRLVGVGVYRTSLFADHDGRRADREEVPR